MSLKNHTLLEKVILVGLSFSGAAALIYEVVWSRSLSLVIGSTTYAFSILLAAFMTGLTIGGYFGGKLADKVENPAKAFGYIEGMVAIFGLVTYFAIRYLTPIYSWLYEHLSDTIISFYVAQYVLVFLIMIIPTTLMGMTFPLALKIRAKNLDEIGREGGDVYSINNLGAVAGSLLAGFVLIPKFGMNASNIVAVLLNATVSITILFLATPSLYSRFFSMLLAFAVPFAAYFVMKFDESKLRYSFYNASRYSNYGEYEYTSQFKKIVYSNDDPQGLVQVFFNRVEDVMTLVNNAKVEGMITRKVYQVSDEPHMDWTNQLLLSYLPLELNKNAETFLNIGLGTGTTLRATMSESSLREIDCIEINRSVAEAVEKFFYPELFVDPRVTVYIDDARRWLQYSKKKYDIISSEPSYPVDRGMSNLFSSEFFELVKGHLNNKGVYVQWLPQYLLNDENLEMMIRTFARAFPYVQLWKISVTSDMIMVGSMEPFEETGNIEEMVLAREKADKIRGNFSPYLNPEKIRKIALSEGKLNTDNTPFLEFDAANLMISGKM